MKLTRSFSGVVLEKVAEYFYYNWRNRDQENVKDMDIPPELCLELLMAADYLDSKLLSSSLRNATNKA
jgi:transcription elongation factor B subunit 1